MATKRLIDANDALERLEKAEQEMMVVSMMGCKAVPMHGVIEFIKTRPTVDAVEVVHGRWEFDHTTAVEKYDVVKCSNCGHEAFAIAIYVKEGHYCPNCGAKMDGDGNGTLD